jgi:hypothetical protein
MSFSEDGNREDHRTLDFDCELTCLVARKEILLLLVTMEVSGLMEFDVIL